MNKYHPDTGIEGPYSRRKKVDPDKIVFWGVVVIGIIVLCL